MLLLWLLAFHAGAVRSADERWYLDAPELHARSALLNERGYLLVRLVDPAQFALLVAGLAGIAALRRRSSLLLRVLLVTVGAAAATELLKLLLDGGGGRAAPQTDFPSGHATAAAAVALCLVMVVPRGLRAPAGLLGAAWVAVVAVELVAMGTHRPSDVVAGLLVAAAFAARGRRLIRADSAAPPSAQAAPRGPR